MSSTMRLSDAGLRRHPTKLFYPDHRIHSLAQRRCAPRSLEPIVRRVVTSVTCGHPISKPAVRPLCSRQILAQAPRVHRRPERQPFALARTQMPRQQLRRSKRTGSPNPATYRVVPSPIHSALRETSISIRESRVHAQTSSNDQVERCGASPASNEST
jgi:hypothetical protein